MYPSAVSGSEDRFYSFRYEELRGEGLVTAAAALATSYGDSEELAAPQIDQVLGQALEKDRRAPTEDAIAKVRTRLHDLGYTWSPGGKEARVYVSGIPSLMSYVSKIAAA